MRYYELLYIINPNFEQDRLNKVMEKVSTELNGKKVSIINHYVWSKKRLAYMIQKYKYGTFVILQFETDKYDFFIEFEKFLELEKSILRHQLVRLDTKPEVHKDKPEDLYVDEQPNAEVVEKVGKESSSVTIDDKETEPEETEPEGSVPIVEEQHSQGPVVEEID